MIQWMPYYYWFVLLDIVGYRWFNDSLLIARDIISYSMHQPLISIVESYIGILLVFISILYCLFIPSIAIILANLIDVYLFGILFIILHQLIYIAIIGIIFISEWLLLFISSSSIFVLFLSFIELSSIILQSITITNRLSINIIAGGLLVNILFIVFDLYIVVDCWPWMDYRLLLFMSILSMLFDFEILTMINQFIIFILLLFIIIH